MFGAKKKKSENDSGGVMQKSSRGNMDEYEALRTIIAENTGLLTRVLEKIRVQRAMSGKSPSQIADKAAKDKEAAENKTSKKNRDQ